MLCVLLVRSCFLFLAVAKMLLERALAADAKAKLVSGYWYQSFRQGRPFFSSKSSGVNEASKPGWRHPWARRQEFYGLSLHVLGSIFATAKHTLFLQACPAAFQRQRSGEKKRKKNPFRASAKRAGANGDPPEL